ncbi:MAG: rhomboid family intramembrane serine protease [Ignavibacteria bacterium]|nr:rhomboid family intramembrane serine protease [Ignavibacteria bacterium]
MSNSFRPRGFGRFSLFPPIIKNLLIINAAVFFLQLIAGNFLIGGKPGLYVLQEWFALNPLVEGANFQVWQLITYQFMHAGFGHIFFNMFMLWMFGMEIENIMGSKKFLYYYLICGVAAGLAQLFIAPLFSVPALTIGASGAVFGVMIAFALMFPDRLIFLWFLIPIKAKYLIGFLFVLEIFWIGDAGSNVAHLAHLGGAIAGFIFIMMDKQIDVTLKHMFNKSYYRTTEKPPNIFSGITERFRKNDDEVKEAKFYDLKEDVDEKITQEDIDEILDKISKSGYQNLTEKEKKTLFEASKKMN